MTPEAFTALALSMPDAVQGSHMGHADFRVGVALGGKRGGPGRIFASLPPPKDGQVRGMLKLPREDQAALIAAHPDVWIAAAGSWGEQGCTYVNLRHANARVVKAAIAQAWRHALPEKVLAELEGEGTRTPRRTAQKKQKRDKPTC